METFYTYLWLREDGTPYYVGKGKGKRGFISAGHSYHRPKDSTRIITQEWPSESDAFVAEKFLISYYGRMDLGTGLLANRTDGGDGTSGYRWTQDHKDKISISHQGKKRSKTHCRNISKSMMGNTRTLGIKYSDKVREKVSIAMKKSWDARRAHAKQETKRTKP
jgi:hypothetical protein